MEQITAEVKEWLATGEEVAIATVVSTWGSAPRREGAKLAVTADGAISGSVSGGCVEGAVVEAGVEVLKGGKPRLLHFGVADETAWEVGLACGGEIEVFVERLDPSVLSYTRQWLETGRTGVVVTIIDGSPAYLGRHLLLDDRGATAGSFNLALDEGAIQLARAALHAGESRRATLESEPNPIELFLDVLQPPPTLVVVGGVHIAIPLTRMAQAAGYQTIVVDPRRAFGSIERFPHVDRLIQAWPQQALAEVELGPHTAVALLTHDPKIDDPALEIVLDKQVFYVGALGSNRTHARRRRRLLEAGLTPSQVDRIQGPIGLDINARTPEEIAVAILAEIVKVKNREKEE
jgi:xanthine dehydrogenase accessory factor